MGWIRTGDCGPEQIWSNFAFSYSVTSCRRSAPEHLLKIESQGETHIQSSLQQSLIKFVNEVEKSV